MRGTMSIAMTVAPFLAAVHQLFVLRRVEERNQRLAFAQAFDLGVDRRAHLGNDIGGFEQRGGGFHHLDTCGLISRVRKPAAARPRFRSRSHSQAFAMPGDCRASLRPGLACKYFFWCSDFQFKIPRLVRFSKCSRRLMRQVKSLPRAIKLRKQRTSMKCQLRHLH